jgi:hypothetical protein
MLLSFYTILNATVCHWSWKGVPNRELLLKKKKSRDQIHFAVSKVERVGILLYGSMKKAKSFNGLQKSTAVPFTYLPLVPRGNQLPFLVFLVASLHRTTKKITAITSWFVNFGQHLWIYVTN